MGVGYIHIHCTILEFFICYKLSKEGIEKMKNYRNKNVKKKNQPKHQEYLRNTVKQFATVGTGMFFLTLIMAKLSFFTFTF